MALTARQQRFAAEYAVDLNATQAAIRAGYSPKTAMQQGSRLLSHVEIKAALVEVHETVAAVVAERVDHAVGEAAWIVQKAVEVVGRALNAVPVTRMERGKVVTVEGEWTCNLSAATPALTLLAKRHPEFRDAAPTVEVKVLVVGESKL